MKWITLIALLFSFLAPTAFAAGGPDRALLIGSYQYPQVARSVRAQLTLGAAPNNVAEWKQLLVDMGMAADNVQTMVAGADGSGAPTRFRVLQALDAVAASAQPREWIFVYLSGHGAQSEVPSDFKGYAPGKVRSIYLPEDARMWDGASKTAVIPNAIYDFEIAERVARMRDRGAYVWVLLDSCHPGNLAEVMPASKRTDGLGGFVAFYAARPDQTSFEWNMRMQTETKPKWRSVFSFVVRGAIRRKPQATFTELIAEVQSEYASIPQLRGDDKPKPYINGTDVDVAPFDRTQPFGQTFVPFKWAAAATCPLTQVEVFPFAVEGSTPTAAY